MATTSSSSSTEKQPTGELCICISKYTVSKYYPSKIIRITMRFIDHQLVPRVALSRAIGGWRSGAREIYLRFEHPTKTWACATHKQFTMQVVAVWQ